MANDIMPARFDTKTEGGICWIVAHNPGRLNAYTRAMWEELPALMRAADADAEARVIVLRGAGERAFSAGADITEFESTRTGSEARAYDLVNHRAFEAVATAAKPTVAMIHGYCFGGGLELAICCDLRIAADNALFSIPAAKLGIGYNPRWVRPMLAVMSPARAKEILFTGRRYDAAEALAMGLVNRLVPTAELEAETRALAGEIAANAPLSIRAAKRAIEAMLPSLRDADLAHLDRLVEDCFESEDYAEGRRAFTEKRKPVFRGR